MFSFVDAHDIAFNQGQPPNDPLNTLRVVYVHIYMYIYINMAILLPHRPSYIYKIGYRYIERF